MSSVTIGSRTVEVRELSVAEIRGWLNGLESVDIDLLGQMLFEDIDFNTIALMSDLTIAELDQMLPSDIREVARQVKAVNCHFFSFAQRLGKLGAQIKPEGLTDAPSDGSNETAPPS